MPNDIANNSGSGNSTASGPVVPGTRKVTVSALAGALVTVAMAFVPQDASFNTPQVAAALSTIVMAVLFYVTPESYNRPGS